MILSQDNLETLEKIANALDKSGEKDRMLIADQIDDVIKLNAALEKIAVDIIHPDLLSLMSAKFPKAFHNIEVAKQALRFLSQHGSGSIKGVSLQDLNNLRNELKKVISGQEESVGVHEIGAA